MLNFENGIRIYTDWNLNVVQSKIHIFNGILKVFRFVILFLILRQMIDGMYTIEYTCIHMASNTMLKNKKSTVLTLRISPEIQRGLTFLSETSKRSKAYLAEEALSQYIEENAWQAKIIQERKSQGVEGPPAQWQLPEICLV